jgi:hypothetical protein
MIGWFPPSITTFAPEVTVIVTSLLMFGSGVISPIVFPAIDVQSIVSPGGSALAWVIAARKVPGPLFAGVVTEIVAAAERRAQPNRIAPQKMEIDIQRSKPPALSRVIAGCEDMSRMLKRSTPAFNIYREDFNSFQRRGS